MSTVFIKRSSSADNLLRFLLASTFSVTVTRLYLHLMNYPQITRGDLHIAHSVFGGIFLTASVLLLLTFHGRKIRQFSAILAGLGFGQFIDEIGKFITKDSNYFYQPVPVIIYISLISLFFLYRALDRYTPHDDKERAFDIIEGLEDLADNQFFLHQREKIRKLIKNILSNNEAAYHWIALGAQEMLSHIPVKKKPQRSFFVLRLQTSWYALDQFLSERKPVFYMLVCIFIVYVGFSFWTMSTFLYRVMINTFDPIRLGIESRADWYIYVAELVSSLASSLLMCRGLWELAVRQRQRALILFKNGLAINILITHIFAFYIEQFSAIVSLVAMLVLFALVDNILEDDDTLEGEVII